MMNSPLFAMFGAPGWLEMAIIGGIVLVLFGNRLPGAMRSLGRSFVEFKKGVKGIDENRDADSEDSANPASGEPQKTEPS